MNLTEDKIQIDCVYWLNTWLDILGRDEDGFGVFIFWSHPNENNMGARMGDKLNKMGRHAGLSDLGIQYEKDGVTHMLFIELKTKEGFKKKDARTERQRRFIAKMNSKPNTHGVMLKSLPEFRATVASHLEHLGVRDLLNPQQ
ncbi:hypothetical protein N9K75_02825 [bacterium]|nr:hypothetical protein [bacterium]